jgi:uncharacterized spore protein YtfJ
VIRRSGVEAVAILPHARPDPNPWEECPVPTGLQACDRSLRLWFAGFIGSNREGGTPMEESVSEVQKTIEQAKDALTVRRVFGDPYEKNGVTVIPAARVQGGGGGGTSEGNQGGEGKGSGSGFGLNARPAGAYVIRGDEVDWRPAVDPNKVIVGAALVAFAALLLARTAIKARAPRGS